MTFCFPSLQFRKLSLSKMIIIWHCHLEDKFWHSGSGSPTPLTDHYKDRGILLNGPPLRSPSHSGICSLLLACDSKHLGCLCSPWVADSAVGRRGGTVFVQIGSRSGSCGTGVPRASRPGLLHRVRAKLQWHPSHLKTHLAWVQTHKHKIKLCFFWISSQLQWLALPDQ